MQKNYENKGFKNVRNNFLSVHFLMEDVISSSKHSKVETHRILNVSRPQQLFVLHAMYPARSSTSSMKAPKLEGFQVY